jgi:hypothetical protein
MNRSRLGRWLLSSGVGRVIAFNWPKYVVALVALVCVATVAVTTNGLLSWLLFVMSLGLAYGLIVSVVATWWIYDGSHLRQWNWVSVQVRPPVSSWLLIHAGFDEVGDQLNGVLGSPARRYDLSPALNHTSPSLRRAQAWLGSADTPLRSVELPEHDGVCGVVVLAFAAHELGVETQLAQLLSETRRVLKDDGVVLLVEHCRDLPNTLVYGPGAWHFRTARFWTGAAHKSGLKLASEARCTPFVRSFALCRA